MKKKIRVSFDIDKEKHILYKIEAIKEGKTMQEFLSNCLQVGFYASLKKGHEKLVEGIEPYEIPNGL
jgi:hypothetical protein